MESNSLHIDDFEFKYIQIVLTLKLYFSSFFLNYRSF